MRNVVRNVPSRARVLRRIVEPFGPVDPIEPIARPTTVGIAARRGAVRHTTRTVITTIDYTAETPKHDTVRNPAAAVRTITNTVTATTIDRSQILVRTRRLRTRLDAHKVAQIVGDEQIDDR